MIGSEPSKFLDDSIDVEIPDCRVIVGLSCHGHETIRGICPLYVGSYLFMSFIDLFCLFKSDVLIPGAAAVLGSSSVYRRDWRVGSAVIYAAGLRSMRAPVSRMWSPSALATSQRRVRLAVAYAFAS